MESQMKTLVIVPVFNEWPHLLTVLQDLRAHFSDILVIDDGSDDISYLSRLREERYYFISLPFSITVSTDLFFDFIIARAQ